MHFLRHVKDVHRQWRPYLCHHCGKAFKRPDALKQHSVLHAAPGAPDSKLAHFQCRPCGKICRSRAHLKGNCYATHCGNKPVRPFIKRIHVGRAPSRPFIGAIFSVRDLRRVFQDPIRPAEARGHTAQQPTSFPLRSVQQALQHQLRTPAPHETASVSCFPVDDVIGL